MDRLQGIFKRMGIEADVKPMSNEEFRQFAVDCYNESAGDLDKEDGIQCVICNNKGWIQTIDGGYETHRHCQCWKRREGFKKAKQSGLGKYLKKSIDDYIVEEEWQGRCKRMVEGYIERHSHDNTWFIACGQSGCGKTLLGSIIANTLLTKKERAVTYVVWTDFIGKVKRDMMSERANEVSNLMEEVKNTDVLFLDEVLKKYNDTDLRYLMEIINYRYTTDKKTILTSEKPIAELLDIDEATFSRGIEMADSFVINIPKDQRKNYRVRKVLNGRL